MDICINKLELDFNEKLIPLKNPERLIIHHTHNPDLTTITTHQLHQNRNRWAGIGYNYFIEKDGRIFKGRGMFVGAHAFNYNKTSIGIALAGNFDVDEPSKEQIKSLLKLCKLLMEKHDIESKNVIGHNELPKVTKSCPGEKFNMKLLRKTLIEEYMKVGEKI